MVLGIGATTIGLWLYRGNNQVYLDEKTKPIILTDYVHRKIKFVSHFLAQIYALQFVFYRIGRQIWLRKAALCHIS